MLYWDIFTARGWVATFVICHYWGSFVTSSNDCILTPLLCLLLPFGMRDAEHRSPKNLWNSSRWFASGASLTISVASAQVRPSQFPLGDSHFWQLGYRQCSLFMFECRFQLLIGIHYSIPLHALNSVDWSDYIRSTWSLWRPVGCVHALFQSICITPFVDHWLCISICVESHRPSCPIATIIS